MHGLDDIIVKTLAGMVVTLFGWLHFASDSRMKTLENKVDNTHEIYVKRDDFREYQKNILDSLRRIEDFIFDPRNKSGG